MKEFIFIVLCIIGLILWMQLKQPHKLYLDLSIPYKRGCIADCNADCKLDKSLTNSDKSLTNSDKSLTNSDKPPLIKKNKLGDTFHINYNKDGLHTAFPLQTRWTGQHINDITPEYIEDIKLPSSALYDADNKLINGNVEKKIDSYDDHTWKMQSKPACTDVFTAADLHLSRKPREAFHYQSRWGINSIRPWIAKELDDAQNKIWWEDNEELDAYM
jgi:hypothetical protein